MISASSYQTIATPTPVTIANQTSLQPNALPPDSTIVVVCERRCEQPERLLGARPG